VSFSTAHRWAFHNLRVDVHRGRDPRVTHLAAQMEEAVRDVEESSRNLHLAAKSIGMTEEAAKFLVATSGQLIYT
jgi:hypothetical protein